MWLNSFLNSFKFIVDKTFTQHKVVVTKSGTRRSGRMPAAHWEAQGLDVSWTCSNLDLITEEKTFPKNTHWQFSIFKPAGWDIFWEEGRPGNRICISHIPSHHSSHQAVLSFTVRIMLKICFFSSLGKYLLSWAHICRCFRMAEVPDFGEQTLLAHTAPSWTQEPLLVCTGSAAPLPVSKESHFGGRPPMVGTWAVWGVFSPHGQHSRSESGLGPPAGPYKELLALLSSRHVVLCLDQPWNRLLPLRDTSAPRGATSGGGFYSSQL